MMKFMAVGTAMAVLASTLPACVASAGASSAKPRFLPPSAFVGQWRGGEGTYMKISHSDDGFTVDNQWGLDPDMHGVFTGRMTAAGLSFQRQGVTVIVRPSVGDAVERSALAGKKDCLKVSREEGYCRY